MAQLRDAKTSEILYAGDPSKLVLLADKLGGAVIWDDVAPNTDFKLLLEYAKETMAKKDQTRILKLAADAEKIASSAQNPDVDTLPHVEV